MRPTWYRGLLRAHARLYRLRKPASSRMTGLGGRTAASAHPTGYPR